jgi:acetate kinase
VNALFPPGYGMTDAKLGSNILALNSGSSSLKFGLYRAGPSRTERLLSGEAESIGEKKGRFYAQDSCKNALLSETVSIPSQREAIIHVARLLADWSTLDQSTKAPHLVEVEIVPLIREQSFAPALEPIGASEKL